MENKPERNESFERFRAIGLLTTIPMVMVAGLLVGYFFGSWIDKVFHVSPWGKIVLSILGVIAGFKQTIRLIQEATAEKGHAQENKEKTSEN